MGKFLPSPDERIEPLYLDDVPNIGPLDLIHILKRALARGTIDSSNSQDSKPHLKQEPDQVSARIYQALHRYPCLPPQSISYKYP